MGRSSSLILVRFVISSANCANFTIYPAGITHAYGGVLSALSINYTLTPVAGDVSGSEQRWMEREVVTALYPDRQEVLVTDEREVIGDFQGY
jgi:hypothetical protein